MESKPTHRRLSNFVFVFYIALGHLAEFQFTSLISEPKLSTLQNHRFRLPKLLSNAHGLRQ